MNTKLTDASSIIRPRNTKKVIIFGASVIAIGSLAWFAAKKHSSANREKSTLTIFTKKRSISTTSANSTTVNYSPKVFAKQNSAKRTQAIVIPAKQTHRVKNPTVVDVQHLELPLSSNDNVAKTPGTVQPVQNDVQGLSLSQFWQQLEKVPQNYKINNGRDTLIKAKEGTVIFLPARCFNTDQKVDFIIKEYFDYPDMIKNRLSTTSDGLQLQTGGMMYLSAKADGKEIMLREGSAVRVFLPGITSKDSMQIFYGGNDEASSSSSDQRTGIKLNWQLTKIRIDSPVYKKFVRAIDLRSDHAVERIRMNNKTVGVFTQASTSELSKSELLEMLKKRYAEEYDIIKVRKLWKKDILFRKNIHEEEIDYWGIYNPYGVGDTATLLPRTASIFRLTPIDSVYRVVSWIRVGVADVRRFAVSNKDLKAIGEKYSIGIDKLGWINCDRFLSTDPSKMANVKVELDSAYNYTAYMIFDSYRSILNGASAENVVYFTNVPVGEKVKLFFIGLRNGKLETAIKETIISNKPISGIEFEPADPNKFSAYLSKAGN